jgi:prepilin-type N-terminal cleavage/methylation domain-containing protein
MIKNRSKSRLKGFTLIELLVVIAIIGILSAVVLASLNTARTKGSDAAIASNLSTVQTQAEIYFGGAGSNRYNSNGTSGLSVTTCTNTGNTVLADANVWNAIQAAIAANGGTAASISRCAVANDGTSYSVSIQSKVTPANFYCIDSTGYRSPTVGGALKANGGGGSAALCS